MKKKCKERLTAIGSVHASGSGRDDHTRARPAQLREINFESGGRDQRRSVGKMDYVPSEEAQLRSLESQVQCQIQPEPSKKPPLEPIKSVQQSDFDSARCCRGETICRNPWTRAIIEKKTLRAPFARSARPSAGSILANTSTLENHRLPPVSHHPSIPTFLCPQELGTSQTCMKSSPTDTDTRTEL